MLIKKLQHLAAYYELYEFVADTKNTQAQIKMYLINEADVPESTARRNIKGFVEDAEHRYRRLLPQDVWNLR